MNLCFDYLRCPALWCRTQLRLRQCTPSPCATVSKRSVRARGLRWIGPSGCSTGRLAVR
jgi:hypothetical protein